MKKAMFTIAMSLAVLSSSAAFAESCNAQSDNIDGKTDVTASSANPTTNSTTKSDTISGGDATTPPPKKP